MRIGHSSGMDTTPAAAISLPRQRGPVTVRLGGLDDDLDVLNEGNELWWGQEFLAERIRSSPPEDPWMILVGEVDDEAVGYAFVLGKGVMAGGFAMGDVYVAPRGRRRGVGRALLEAVTDATSSYRLPGLVVSTPELDSKSRAVATGWGFQLVGTHRESVLDLDAMDRAAASSAVERAESKGFRLVPLPADADDAMWQRVYDLNMRIWKDAPDSDGATDEMSYPVFRGFLPHPHYVFLANRIGGGGDQLVGTTSVMNRTKDGALNILFTGVLPEARGNGLAAGLTGGHALLMREHGHHCMYTQNMEGNMAILAANDLLGFRVDSGFVDLALAVPER